jgi:uncharacterized membrane protein
MLDIIRIILGIPFLLFIPGFALLSALIPRKEPQHIVETITLSFVLSLAVDPLLGLIINYTPWGIRLDTVLYSVSIFVFICLVIARVRIHNLHPVLQVPKEQVINSNEVKQPFFVSGVKNTVLTIVMVITCAGALGLILYFIMTPKSQEGFTSFYIEQQQTNPDISLMQLKVGEEGKVTVAINNEEGIQSHYRIEVFINGEKSGEVGPIELAWKQEWHGDVSFTPTTASRQKIELSLYRNDGMTPYFKPLYFWIDVSN